MPAELARSRPRVCLVRAFMALTGGDPAAAQAALEALSHAPEQAGESFQPSVGRAASLVANVPAATAIAHAWLAYLHGAAEQMATFAEQARTELRDDEWMLTSIYRLNLALADWLRGRVGEAEREFAAGVAGWRAAGEPALVAQGGSFLGQVQCARGRLDAALASYRDVLEIASPPGGPELPVAGIGYVGLAQVEYQRDELEAAYRHVTDGIARCRELSDFQPLATGLATLAWIRQAQGDTGGARNAMAEAERAGPSPVIADLLNPVPAEQARLALAQGDAAAAAHWTQSRGLRPDTEPDYAREPEYLVLARVLLAQHAPGQAVALLERLRALAESQGRAGSLIEIQALLALALAASGDDGGALDALTEALLLASPQRYVRVFADEGLPMSALLSRVVAAQRAGSEHSAQRIGLDYLVQILRAAGEGPVSASRPSPAPLPGLIESLTSREMEVLALLAAGWPNQRIADDLVVTLDTVKKHVTHLLGKLGGANRTEAVARARQLGIIP